MQAFGLAVLLYVMGANETTTVLERSGQKGASTAVRNAIVAGVVFTCLIEVAAFITAAVIFHNVKEEVGPARTAVEEEGSRKHQYYAADAVLCSLSSTGPHMAWPSGVRQRLTESAEIPFLTLTFGISLVNMIAFIAIILCEGLPSVPRLICRPGS